MPKIQYTSIKPVSSAIDELVRGLGIKKKLQEYDAIVNWDQVVGEQIAKVSTVKRITQGVIFIHVKTSTWRNELIMRKKEIIDKLNKANGIDIIKDIKFQ